MIYETRLGTYKNCSIGGNLPYRAFIPPPLPPSPQVVLDKFYPLIDKANAAIGRLDGISSILPDTAIFLFFYVRKEAVLSSQIEGTQSSLSDLLRYENNETADITIDDVTEVSCYINAMDYGIDRLKTLPLSLRLIREIHARLMNNARGGDKSPGEFRKSQNWIGGAEPARARFVPPPPEDLMPCLDAFEKFLHDDTIQMPSLIRAAFAHVQFETIHPFLDGNGRLGRLLISFILCTEGMMSDPLLYLSLYFKTNRQAYYNHLQAVRETGDWESWVEFFLIGVIETATQAFETAGEILHLFDSDKKKIEQAGNNTAGVLLIHAYLQKQPITGTSRVCKETKLSHPTVMRSFKVLTTLGIVSETTGKPRNKQFVYTQYLEILNRDTEPLER